jgi:hypothetical protein
MKGPDPDDIEFRLRTFRPRLPSPLHERFVMRRSRVALLIAAAAGIAAGVLIVPRVERSSMPPPERVDSATLGTLTTLALADPDALDAVLTRISRESLPDVRRAGGALQQLAKE